MQRLTPLAVGLLLLTLGTALAESGLKPDQKVPALKVFDCTGEHKGKDVDYAQIRGDKPTLYFFIKELDRPQARFLRALDTFIAGQKAKGLYCVAVFMHKDDPEDIKAHLPRIQKSIKLQATAMVANPAGREMPKGWGLDPDVFVTIVIANKGKAVKSFEYLSVNETDAPAVIAALEKTLK